MRALGIEAHLHHTRETLAPTSPARLPHFLEGAERTSRPSTAFSEANLERMWRVTATLDPGNRFCHGFGIA